MLFKTALAFSVMMLLLTGCNQEELDRLTAQNASLQEEKADLEKKVANLEKTIERAGPAQKQLSFLSDKLKGVKARIVTNHGNIELVEAHV